MWKDKECTHQTLIQQERVCLTTDKEVYKTHNMDYWELWSLYEPVQLLERLGKTMLQKESVFDQGMNWLAQCSEAKARSLFSLESS